MKTRYLKTFLAASLILCACSSNNQSSIKSENNDDHYVMIGFDEEPTASLNNNETIENDATDSNPQTDTLSLEITGQKEELPEGFKPVSKVNSKVKFDDFSDFDQIVDKGMLEGAKLLPTNYVTGEWKFNLRVPDAFGAYSFSEAGLADVDVDYSTGIMTIILHPQIASDGYEQYEEREEEVGYEPFKGSATSEESGFYLDGNNMSLHVQYYYFLNGKEYLVTTGYRISKEYAHLIFVREQE